MIRQRAAIRNNLQAGLARLICADDAMTSLVHIKPAGVPGLVCAHRAMAFPVHIKPERGRVGAGAGPGRDQGGNQGGNQGGTIASVEPPAGRPGSSWGRPAGDSC